MESVHRHRTRGVIDLLAYQIRFTGLFLSISICGMNAFRK